MENNNELQEIENALNKNKSAKVVEEIKRSQEAKKSNFKIILALFVSVALIGIYQVYNFATDDSIMMFSCSSTPSLDASVRLQRLDNISDKDLETLMKGFIRRYVRARYPKNSIEAKYMWEYVANHSEGRIKDDFRGRLQELDEFGKNLDSGQVISIYPIFSKKPIIREVGSGWEIELPVRRVNSVGVKGDERTEPIIKMKVEVRKPTLSGSNSGLVVTQYKVVYIPDLVSKKEIVLE